MLHRDSAHVAAQLLEREGAAAPGEGQTPLTTRVRAFVHDRARRARYVDMATAHLGRRTARGDGPFDVVLIGAGLHAAAFLYTLRSCSPHLRALVLEKSAQVCSTFAGLGDALVLNSPTFSRVGLNANIMPGHFVQVSDFDEVAERPFPTAKHLHQLAAMVLFHADANIEFGFDAVDITRRGATYVVSSNDRHVQARSVVVCNGMGEPEDAAYEFDHRSQDIVFGDAFIARCFEDPDFVTSVRGKSVAVVGAGDTANCVMEYLVPLHYPNDDYGVGGSSAILPRSIVWVGQRATDVREYFFANKRRYCHSGGVIELFWQGDEPLELPAGVWAQVQRTIRCVPDRLVSVAHEPGGLALTTTSQTLRADIVIDCTGRSNRLSMSLREGGVHFVDGDITLLGGRWDEALERHTAAPRSLRARRVACRLPAERVFFLGSACPLSALIPDEEAGDGSMQHEEDRASLTDSKWSLEHTLPRTVAFAQQFACEARLASAAAGTLVDFEHEPPKAAVDDRR